jgi:phage portal protein BeeE
MPPTTAKRWQTKTMGLFNRTTKAAISPYAETEVKAAAVGGGIYPGGYSGQNAGVNMIGNYYSYFDGAARSNAMRVPTISRARDLMASVLGCVPLEAYQKRWNETTRDLEEIEIAPRTWMEQPDPSVTYSFTMSWTFDDLFFYGSAFWYITEYTADGWPAKFTRLPSAMVTLTDQQGPVRFGPSQNIYFQGGQLDPKDVIQFISPIQGIIYQSPTVIQTALELEAARLRNANSAIPAGILRQTGGEPLSGQELADLAASFNVARATNQTAALNQYVTYESVNSDPSKMLLSEATDFQALECARLCNIPPYLAGVSIGSYSYATNQGARQDLWAFGVQPYAHCIEQTLSQNNVLPRGTYVRFDIDDYLTSTYGEEEEDHMADMNEMPPTGNTVQIPSSTNGVMK